MELHLPVIGGQGSIHNYLPTYLRYGPAIKWSRLVGTEVIFIGIKSNFPADKIVSDRPHKYSLAIKTLVLFPITAGWSWPLT